MITPQIMQSINSTLETDVISHKMPLKFGAFNAGEACLNVVRHQDKISVIFTSKILSHAVDIPKAQAVELLDKLREWANK